MGLFDSLNEKKKKKAEEEAAAKAEAEYQAKFAAKQEKKKVEKTITEIDKSIANFIAKAAEAKQKGYADMYRQCVSFIKTARVRKKQAEMFLFQVDAMQEMQNITKNSSELLKSMNTVMSTLGKLSVDKSVLIKSQKDFMTAQAELNKQTDSIGMALSSMDDFMTDSEDSSVSFADEDIDAEINSFMQSSASFNTAPAAGTGSSASTSTGGSQADDMANLRSMLGV